MLNNILKKPAIKPPMITIAGSTGSGKTSLAALFPNVAMIMAEDGTAAFSEWDEDLQPLVFDRIRRATESYSPKGKILEYINLLATAEHDRQTLVIDTVTEMHALFEQEMCLKYKVATAGDGAGGYQKGYEELALWHKEILYACEVLRARTGMTVVFLAHEAIEKIKIDPEGPSDYAVFDIDLHKKSRTPYVALSDVVAFINQEAIVVGQEVDKKGKTTKFGRLKLTGVRRLISSSDGRTGYMSAKNRYNMDPIVAFDLGENPFLELNFYKNKTKTPKTKGDK